MNDHATPEPHCGCGQAASTFRLEFVVIGCLDHVMAVNTFLVPRDRTEQPLVAMSGCMERIG